jgi:hypothetical protein
VATDLKRQASTPFSDGFSNVKHAKRLGHLSAFVELRQVNIVVASVDGHMADDQVRTSSKVARGTPKWRSS